MDIAKIIQEAATWIEKVNKDYETNLYRTPELRPDRHLIHIPDDEQRGVVEDIVKKRSIILQDLNVELLPIENLHHYGRIMIFDVNSTVCDGAPQDVSHYYIYINDAPPMDTWIGLGSQFIWDDILEPDDELLNQSILAWVPASQYFYANEAILVACVDNFAWPNPQRLYDSYSFLAPLFTRPEFVEPAYPINFERRKRLMEDFEKELDKNGPKY
jgi:hypothetical protein